MTIITMKNGYFIGNINPTCSDKPRWPRPKCETGQLNDVSFRKNSSHCGVVELRQQDTKRGHNGGCFHAGGDKNTPLRSCLQIVLGCIRCVCIAEIHEGLHHHLHHHLHHSMSVTRVSSSSSIQNDRTIAPIHLLAIHLIAVAT